MVKDVLSSLDYSLYAESALLLFVVVFAAVSYCMAKMTSEWSRACAEIPLNEDQAEYR